MTGLTRNDPRATGSHAHRTECCCCRKRSVWPRAKQRDWRGARRGPRPGYLWWVYMRRQCSSVVPEQGVGGLGPGCWQRVSWWGVRGGRGGRLHSDMSELDTGIDSRGGWCWVCFGRKVRAWR